MELVETDFYKNLSEERKKIVLAYWNQMKIVPAFKDGFIRSVIKQFTLQFNKEDGIKTPPEKVEYITYYVREHPNDDPYGYKKLTVRPGGNKDL